MTIIKRTITLAVGVVLALGLVGCGSSSAKQYDIGPLFPATADKCEKYHGKPEGTGLTASCWVGLEDCQRAAADWNKAMKGIPDAITFRCT
ncbi:MAG: hypothetical protein LBI33_07375 [Propionibacteriaceae bacterium]|jgi:hypothetical protein|nr:hypothetical protein [Propionibacteriaceae bacterium]